MNWLDTAKDGTEEPFTLDDFNKGIEAMMNEPWRPPIFLMSAQEHARATATAIRKGVPLEEEVFSGRYFGYWTR